MAAPQQETDALMKIRASRYKLAASARGEDLPVPIRYVIWDSGQNRSIWIGTYLRNTINGPPSESIEKAIKRIPSNQGYHYTADDYIVSYYIGAMTRRDDMGVTLAAINRYRESINERPLDLEAMNTKASVWITERVTTFIPEGGEESGTGEIEKIQLVPRDYTISEVFDTLLRRQPQPSSVFIPTSIVMKGTIRSSSIPIDADHGAEIFDRMRVSSIVPYIKYQSGESYYKVYSGELPVDYSDIMYSETKTEDDHIYMIVWAGEGDQKDATIRSFSQAKIDLRNGTVDFEVPFTLEYRETARMKKRIEDLTNGVIEINGEGRTKGEFYIYNVDYLEEIFLDVIMVILGGSGILFMNEIHAFYPNRVRKNMSYRELDKPDPKYVNEGYIRNQAAVDFSIRRLEANGTESLYNEDMKPISLRRGTKYIKVTVTKSKSYNAAREFKEVLARVFTVYTESLSPLKGYYRNLIPGIFPEKPEGPSIEALPKIDRLKKMAPDMFVKGYARACQRSREPELIDGTRMDYVNDTVANAIELHNRDPTSNIRLTEDDDLSRVLDIVRSRYRGRFVQMPQRDLTVSESNPILQLYTDNRRLMRFPLETPRFLVFCDGEDHTYPTVVSDDKLENFDKFEYLGKFGVCVGA